MSSYADNPLPTLDPNVYDAETARWLALRHATAEPDTSLRAMHAADPERIPSPVMIRRWRRAYPAFDALMVEAETERAVAMMEQTIDIADSKTLLAANAKNGIAARWRMAESLAPALFGQRRILAGDPLAPLALGGKDDLCTYTEAQLWLIARGADPTRLLEAGDPHSPPVQRAGGLTSGDEGRDLAVTSSHSRYPDPGVDSDDR